MLKGRSMGAAVLGSLAVAVGCGSAGGPIVTDGGGDAPEAGGAVMCRSADQFAASHAPDDPCATDADCHDAFLTCVAKDVFACRDSNAETVDAGCPETLPAGIPICPTMAKVSVRLCDARYQLPCKGDTDCGPAGFACVSGQCQEQGGGTCATKADCPDGWDCYAPCPCGAASAPKFCGPPFAKFGCPECAPVPDDARDAGPID